MDMREKQLSCEYFFEGRIMKARLDQALLPNGKTAPREVCEGESIADCGARELKEETGCTAGRLVPLGCVYPSPGFLTEVVHLFAALDLTEGEMQPDEDEFVEVVRLPIAEVEQMVARDEIRDAKTALALYRARLKNLF